MTKKTDCVIWIGHDDPIVRAVLYSEVSAATAELREAEPLLLATVGDIMVLDSPLRGPSLMEIMDDYKPGFWDQPVLKNLPTFDNKEQRDEHVHNLSMAVELAKRRKALIHHIVDSPRTSDIKVEEITRALHPDLQLTDNPKEMQDAMEKQMWEEHLTGK